MGTELLVVFALILLNGYMALAELALVSSRKGRLAEMAAESVPGARAALTLIQDQSKLLSTVQTGITLTNVVGAAFSGATIAEHWGVTLNDIPWITPHGETVAFAVVIVVFSYMTLLLGELVPKRIAVSHPEVIACAVARSVQILALVFAPIVWLLKTSTNAVLALFRIRSDAPKVTEEEVKFLIAEGVQVGVIDPVEKQMLDGVMRLTDRTVRTLMTPRVDMTWLGIEDPIGVSLAAIKKSGYSRFPVARGDLEEVVGIVAAKDLLNRSLDGQPIDIKSSLHPALMIPDTTPVLRLLEQFKRKGQYLAIVIDEYGTVEGVVTVTDILAAIAGDITQPGDTDTGAPVKRADGSLLLDGLMPIDEVEALLSLRDMQSDNDDYHTLAGFFIARLGRLPVTGDEIEWQDHRFEIVDMDGRRVDKVLVRMLPKIEPIDE